MPYKKIPVAVAQGSKWCHGCQQVKPRQMFGVDRRAGDGLNYCCLRCASGKLRERSRQSAEFSRLAYRLTGKWGSLSEVQ
jgi:hypothetical protein